jgi:hypothetical protein
MGSKAKNPESAGLDVRLGPSIKGGMLSSRPKRGKRKEILPCTAASWWRIRRYQPAPFARPATEMLQFAI